jgi:nucleotide-binding universal stress UspA family protein
LVRLSYAHPEVRHARGTTLELNRQSKESIVSNPDIEIPAPQSSEARAPIERLLFVADAAVADVGELPRAVRSVLAAATKVHVLTPTLPGRLAWLSDDVDRCRHVADERLDTVLGHMRAIGVDASGLAGRGSVLTVIADAVADFTPDHILLALRSSEHANWQERRLVEHIEQRFDLPVTAYGVDVRGETTSAAGPLLLCYDGSADAVRAIERAGALFTGSGAVVATVWERHAGFEAGAWLDEVGTSTVDNHYLDRRQAEHAAGVAADGVRVAQEAGLQAAPVSVEATGPVWQAILELADRLDAATIVMGSRGLTGLRSMLHGSVSSAVLEHAERPTLIIRRSVAAA